MDSYEKPPVTPEAMVRIARHEAERALASYTKTALVAFLVLASAISYVIRANRVDAGNNNAALAANRVTAVRLSCAADKAFSEALRSAIDGQIEFVRSSKAPGPPSVKASIQSLERLKYNIPLPDCAERIRQVRAVNAGD